MTTPRVTRAANVCIADMMRYFRRFGWSYEVVHDNIFRTSFRGRHAGFVSLIRVSRDWVVFAINPLVAAPAEGFGPTAMRLLASANHHVNLAKAGIDDDGDAFVQVEMPSENFAFAHFETAVGAMALMADQLVIPLLQAGLIDRMNGGHVGQRLPSSRN